MDEQAVLHMLSGDDRRSIGRSDQVAAIIRR